MKNENVEKALGLYKKYNYANGGQTLQVPEIVVPAPMAPPQISPDTPPPQLAQYNPPPAQQEGENLGMTLLGIGLKAAPLIVAALADGGMVNANGGLVGSLSSLTNAVDKEDPRAQLSDMPTQKEYSGIESSVPLKTPRSFEDGGSVPLDTSGDVPAPLPAGTSGLTPVAELPPVVEPAVEAPKRKPLSADTEAEGRATELEAVLKEADNDKELDEGAKSYLRSQAYADAAKRGLSASALRANFLSRKETALSKNKSVPPAPTAPIAAPTPAAPAAPAAPSEVTAPPAVEPPKATPITGDLAIAKRYADSGVPEAFDKFSEFKAEAIADLGGIFAKPADEKQTAHNAYVLKTSSQIALNASDAWAAGHKPEGTQLEAPKASPEATGGTDGTSVVPSAVAAPTPVSGVSTGTPAPAPSEVAVEKISIPAKSVIYDAAMQAGMPPEAAQRLATQFGDTLLDIEAPSYAGATETAVGAKVSELADKYRKATLAKEVVNAAIDTKTRELRDASADATLQASIDTQRALAAAQANAARLRREIQAGISGVEQYMATQTNPGFWASALGVLGAGLGGGSFQDWYSGRVKEEVQKQYDLLGKKTGLMNLYIEQGKDLDEASKLTEATIKRIYSAQMEKAAGGLLDAKARAEGQMASFKLAMDATKLEGDVIGEVVQRQHMGVQDAIEKQKADANLLKALLDIYHEEDLARISAGRARAPREPKAVAPPEWSKALRGGVLSNDEVGKVGEFDDKKAGQFVAVTRPVRTEVGGVGIYTIAPSTTQQVLARSPRDAEVIKEADISLGDISRAWARMVRIAAAKGFSKTRVAADSEASADYEDAKRSIIAGFSALYKTGVISGGEYERYESQANPLGLTTRGDWSNSLFNSFGKNIADSHQSIRQVRLMGGAAGAGTPEGEVVPPTRIAPPKAGFVNVRKKGTTDVVSMPAADADKVVKAKPDVYEIIK